MKYKDTGFRAFYHHFTAIPMKENLRKALKDFPGMSDADYILTYGYIDHTAGMTLEVLAAALHTEKGFRFAEGNDEVSFKIRIGDVIEDETAYFEDENGILAERYAAKLETLKGYDVSEEIEKTRNMAFLDGCRDEICIDDVLVCLMKDGLKTEDCWVRISGLGEHWIMGTLLNEPEQDFGYHMGGTIGFFVQETEDQRYSCYCDMNPSQTITAEDLEDGSLLEATVTAFNKERTQDHLFDILEILRDSYVWVPCTAVMSEEDQRYWDEIAQKFKDDPQGDYSELIGTEYVSKGETRLIPDILQNGDAFYFPIFSTEEAMGEYGNGFSKVQKHMLEVIPLARNNEKKPVGIVLNAFTEPFVLDESIFEIVEKMKSRIG